jgi:hypothetical protein
LYVYQAGYQTAAILNAPHGWERRPEMKVFFGKNPSNSMGDMGDVPAKHEKLPEAFGLFAYGFKMI